MLSKATVKYIQSLKQKKYRIKSQSFLVEGKKMVEEAMNSDLTVEHLITTATDAPWDKVEVVDESLMKKLSSFSTPSSWMAVVKMKPNDSNASFSQGWVLALDGVKDPGNMGTILRIADWYGIDTVVCSGETVDVYNPKTVQSTMGALFRMNVEYMNLSDYLAQRKADNSNLEVVGACMDGDNIYRENLSDQGVLVMGSESHGIGDEVEKLLSKKITIPGSGRSESLNVGVATGIVCSELFRKKWQ